MTLPGHRIRRWASRVFDEATMARVIEPTLADLQLEYARAHSAGRVWRARWVRVSGYWALLVAVSASVRRSGVHALRAHPGDEPIAGRTAWICGAYFAALVAFFAWMPMWGLVRQQNGQAWLLMMLVPQAITLAMPMAVLLGLSVVLAQRAVSPRLFATVAAMTLLASTFSFGITGWVAPAANQRFRTTIAGEDLPKGYAELTLGELRARSEFRTRIVRDGNRFYFERTDQPPFSDVGLAYYKRYALPAAPIALVFFLLARRRDRNPWTMASQGAIVCVVYYALLAAGQAAGEGGWLSSTSAAWLPNMVFVGAAVLMLLARSHVRLREAPPSLATGL